jgi:hypothetical protein
MASDILQQLDGLSYTNRARFAAKLGKDTDAAQLSELVKDLRQHPAPTIPEIDNEEEGFSELLPPETTNLAPYYHADAAALTAAACKQVLPDCLLASHSFLLESFPRRETQSYLWTNSNHHLGFSKTWPSNK